MWNPSLFLDVMNNGVAYIMTILMVMVQKSVNILCWPPWKCFQISSTILILLADYLLNKAKTVAQKAIVLWLVTVSLIFLAILSYAAFYKAYVPTAEIIKPVHFSFKVCPSGVGVCSFPTANVSFWNEEGTLQEVLGSGQAYSAMLSLEVPESPRNRDLGMFVVAVQMFDRNRAVTSSSERTAMLKYFSMVSRIADFIGWMPLYFFGFKEHKQVVSVMMFPHLVDDYYHPSVGAQVEIRSHGIEIYSSTLTLSAKFSGLKYFLYNWPVTSAIFAFWWNLVIFSIALGLTMYKRHLDMKNMSSSLTVVRSNRRKESKVKTKDGYESDTPSFHSDEDVSEEDEKTALKKTKNSSTQTQPYRIGGGNKNVDDEDDDTVVVQEPADFIPVEREDEFDSDFVNELRNRRIN